MNHQTLLRAGLITLCLLMSGIVAVAQDYVAPSIGASHYIKEYTVKYDDPTEANWSSFFYDYGGSPWQWANTYLWSAGGNLMRCDDYWYTDSEDWVVWWTTNLTTGFYTSYAGPYGGPLVHWARTKYSGYYGGFEIMEDTGVRLVTGGYSNSTAQCLFKLSASATAVQNDEYGTETNRVALPVSCIQIQGQGPSADGYFWITTADNQILDVTPTVSIPSIITVWGSPPITPEMADHFEFTCAGSDTKMQLQIIYTGPNGTNGGTITTNIAGGGNPGTPYVPTVVVGQKIELSASLSGGTANTMSNINWNIPTNVNTAVAGFSTNVSNGGPVALSQAQLTNGSVTLYWVAGGQQQVQLSGTIGGQQRTATGNFNVLRPRAELNLTTPGIIAVDTNSFVGPNPVTNVFLHAGIGNSLTNVGLLFTFTNLDLDGYTGNYTFLTLQTGAVHYVWNLTNGTARQAVNFGIDSGFPYALIPNPITDSFVADSPNMNSLLHNADGSINGAAQIKIDMKATMFLMFKADSVPSIPVPVSLAEWHFLAAATNNATATALWGLATTNDHVKILQNRVTTSDFPSWTNKMQNWNWVTNGSWQPIP